MSDQPNKYVKYKYEENIINSGTVDIDTIDIIDSSPYEEKDIDIYEETNNTNICCICYNVFIRFITKKTCLNKC